MKAANPSESDTHCDVCECKKSVLKAAGCKVFQSLLRSSEFCSEKS